MSGAANFHNSEDPSQLYRHYLFYDWNNYVFNGIAYDDKSESFLVTGKMWDFIYKVRLNEKKDEL